MRAMPEPVSRLIDEFSRLPGIGPKTASRLTFFLLRGQEDQAMALADAIKELGQRIILCSQCFNITEEDPCGVCADEGRDRSLI